MFPDDDGEHNSFAWASFNWLELKNSNVREKTIHGEVAIFVADWIWEMRVFVGVEER